MLIQLGDSPSLKNFSSLFEKTFSLTIENLWGAPKAFLLAHLQTALKRSIVVISSEENQQRFFDDLLFFGASSIFDFPSWETLPDEDTQPSPDIVGKRLSILFTLLTNPAPSIILTSLAAILQKVPKKGELSAKCYAWKVGQTLSFSSLPALLMELGYKRGTVASEKGEFAVRGGILDLFPISSPDPYRLEFFGDTLEEIRIYDPVGQKSIKKVSSLFLSAAKEKEQLSSLLDYLGKETLIVFDDLLSLEDRYLSMQKMAHSSKRLFSFEELLDRTLQHMHLFFPTERLEELSEVALKTRKGRSFYTGQEPVQPLTFTFFDREISTARYKHPFVEPKELLSPFENAAHATEQEMLFSLQRYSKDNLSLFFVANSESEEKLFRPQLPDFTQYLRGYLSGGFFLPDLSFLLLPATELTHRHKIRRPKWRSSYHTPPSTFHELSIGDIVVHFHQGIAKYLGTEKRVNHLGQQTEFLVLEFAENSKFYVPADSSHLVSRYIGAKEEIPSLNSLGSSRWQRQKSKAQSAIVGYAEQLLRMAAERSLRGGFAFRSDSAEMKNFEEDFPFVETEDQLKAICAVKEDMMSTKAMDRLICGDVGYGKTEVALRAAFKAVIDGQKQVALLVPTTILALQHYDTFRERMANYPITVGLLSRFSTVKENRETLDKLLGGSIDVVIGTHRLLSKDVRFKDLGLIIIDEEQRFGVRAKEYLKALKQGVDCLTLSATPIPRTLYLSLVGSKDISTIHTPPQDRLPTKIIIAERDLDTIRTALMRELARDGQAFFIHNRIETIYQTSEEIQKLLPEARLLVGHGQMDPEEIDSIFHAFKRGTADILISTTIIENGVDIPNANTILIDRADRYGLADLYQLKGRVGRWNRPAYAYFLVPKNQTLSEPTKQRLSALIEATGYGGGMKIAMRDLEIRGAGDILGTQQSGQIAAIGFHLYCKLLKQAIEALKKRTPIHFLETKLEFPFNASLPDDYIEESSLRLEIYHRLGEASSFEEIDQILAELKDRFGPPPPAVFWLYHMARLRLFGTRHRFSHLKFTLFSLIAEREKLQKMVTIDQTKDPEKLEKEAVQKLSTMFHLKNDG